MPWRYECHGDSDGETIGYDYFVFDANGNEIASPPTEEIARAMVATAALMLVWQRVPDETRLKVLEGLGGPETVWVGKALAEMPQII